MLKCKEQEEYMLSTRRTLRRIGANLNISLPREFEASNQLEAGRQITLLYDAHTLKVVFIPGEYEDEA
ncbi:hypothetical protein ACFLX5_06035 [Chloroflexota bacterium]